MFAMTVGSRIFALAWAIGAVVPGWAHGATVRISVGPGGLQANGNSFLSALSADGRFVAFVSGADNLVRGDTNNSYDIFVRDRLTGTTGRVSLGRRGVEANDDSLDPSISADGRFIAFESFATNLIRGGSGLTQIFVRDRKMATTALVSLALDGTEGGGFSASPSISADGRFVAFCSDSSNLVPRDTNDLYDVFVRDRLTGTTRRMSLGPGGVEGRSNSCGPAISADGRYVAFYSDADNLVHGDTNSAEDVFVRDRNTGKTQRVSLGRGGIEGNGDSDSPALSADGRYVAFGSTAGNLVPGDRNGVSDVFVHDRRAGTTQRVSLGQGGTQGNGESFNPSISADGRFVAFESVATNLMPGDTNGAPDVFVRSLAP